MKSTTKDIRHATSFIESKLLEEGVVIQKYEAYSTNSVYLKFDCGLSNSLRIGDHAGKQHLSYMFMVDVTHSGRRIVKQERFTQYTYAATKKQLRKVVKHILDHRDRRIDQYGGYANYREQMKHQYIKSKDQKGFWSQAEFINKKREGIKND
ncbi:hypothetical protein UAY_01806 [Enterococcus moraviensis ATCC BAA-383]|uniref:Uncharacterized protein n=1 Tax=Enterococcus moraviensis ATCC BAA-383 TaxID=1158609 RepID=R2SZT2_9ENTE|nr:hypothetical protein [Enterococcus moraviensis]EOI00703.1 hypothetical protein UAY_01806 [Enterococcus moraviensis ATCC BAA-383]EOT73068.1 hypothetical protein I586_00061 [Enterococcus moraviensis ATCC BAA-383]